MDNPWQLCRTIGPLLSQSFPLASAKAQPRGDLYPGTSIKPGVIILSRAREAGTPVKPTATALTRHGP